MRRLVGVALAVALAGCAPAALGPPADPPSAVPAAAPPADALYTPRNPDERALGAALPPPAAPVAGPPLVEAPRVALVTQAFTFMPLPIARSAPAEELQLTQQNLQGWTDWFAQMLTGYQGLYAADAQKQVELKAGFETLIAPGPFAEVVKIWALRDASGSRTFTASDASILKLYAKPWGRAAYADITFKLIESGGAQETTRTLRLRVSVGRSWRVVDAWDANAGRWLVGEAPQYSALALESEVPSAVANYLYNESYIAGGSEQFAQRPGLSQFLQARIDALNEMNNAFKSHRLVDRHFEGVTVKILRFEPATYLGDGVVTVSVSGHLVEVDGSGNSHQTPFTQQMKLLRTVRGGSVNLIAVDQQSNDGTWDSGGDLALYAVDIEFG